MLGNWLQASKNTDEKLASWQLGSNIMRHRGSEFPDLKGVKIAILGVGKETDIIRTYLYQMAFSFGKTSIADIGNLRSPTEESLLPVLKELLEAGIIPIVLGGEINISTAQFKAYQDKYKNINLAIIDQKIDYHKDSSNYLSVIRKVRRPRVANLAFIGYQTHLSPADSIKYYQKKNNDCIRLGAAKANMEHVEPAIRDAHAIYFNLAALKRADAPSLWGNSPSGFTSEEACRLCHYAGISDKLSSIGFYGYSRKNDQTDHTAQLLAEMVWYVLEGVHFRKKDFPASTDRMIEYIVSFKQYDYELTFWKSTKSGRWWVQLLKSTKKNDSHLIPCAYEDYLLAGQDELSERLLNIIERFVS